MPLNKRNQTNSFLLPLSFPFFFFLFCSFTYSFFSSYTFPSSSLSLSLFLSLSLPLYFSSSIFLFLSLSLSLSLSQSLYYPPQSFCQPLSPLSFFLLPLYISSITRLIPAVFNSSSFPGHIAIFPVACNVSTLPNYLNNDQDSERSMNAASPTINGYHGRPANTKTNAIHQDSTLTVVPTTDAPLSSTSLSTSSSMTSSSSLQSALLLSLCLRPRASIRI